MNSGDLLATIYAPTTYTTRHTPKGWAVIAPDGEPYAYRASEWDAERYAERLNTKRACSCGYGGK